MAGSMRWVFATGLAHVLADDAADPLILVAVCGLELPATTPVYRGDAEPSDVPGV